MARWRVGGEKLLNDGEFAVYRLRYTFRDGASLESVVPSGGGNFRDTLFVKGFKRLEALHVLSTSGTDDAQKIDYMLHPESKPADTVLNPLLQLGWTETIFAWGTYCHERASLVYDGTAIIGLTRRQDCR